MSDIIGRFRDEIAAAGLTPPETVVPDGKLHRFSASGKRGDSAGWYVLYEDGIPAGAFGSWRDGISETWCSAEGQTMTEEERRAHRRRMQALQKQRERELGIQWREAAKRAADIWNKARMAVSHQYLIRKRVNAYGLRLHEERLVVPMRDQRRHLSSLQFIDVKGEKRFLTGGKVAGCYHLIGEPSDILCIAEGYATAATIHELTGQAVACAFNAGNLEPVARALRVRYQNSVRLLICADNDHKTDGNPGVTKAQEAAKATCAAIAIPECKGTDFNDMMIERGAEPVKAALRRAIRSKAA